MRMRSIIPLFMLILLIIPLGSAAEIYAKNTNVSLKQPCYNNDFYCSSAAECLITVTNPGNNLTVLNQSMTNRVSIHNYTINSQNTTTSGEYEYCITCRDGAFNASDCFEFTVTTSGLSLSQTGTDTMTRAIYLMFAIGIVLIVGAFFTTKKYPIKWSLIILGCIAILVSVNVLFVSLQDEVINPRIEGLFDFITAASWIMYWFGFGLIILIWFLTVLQTMFLRRTQRNIARFGSAT